jgi:hypothetical protein
MAATISTNDFRTNPGIFTEQEWNDATHGLDYSEDIPDAEEGKTRSREFSFQSYPVASKIVFYALVIGALVAVLIYLLRGNIFLKDRKLSKTETEVLYPEEQLHETDVEALLREAIRNRNYRLAVRYHYLAVIRELSLKRWIEWQKDKTNREYLMEMGSRQQFPLFRELTSRFEWVWYGERQIPETEFEWLSGKFELLMSELSNDEK